jgi:hypothetical protein
VFASSAGAASSSVTKLSVGDAVLVKGTKIVCYALKSNGKIGMACLLLKGNKPQTGSYGAGLAEDGTAVLNKIKADGSSQKIFKRKLQAAHTVYRVKVGDIFGLALPHGLSDGCKVINVTSASVAPIYRGTKVSCWRSTATAPLPKTYGVSISDKFAGVFKFDGHGKVTSWGFVRKQPR